MGAEGGNTVELCLIGAIDWSYVGNLSWMIFLVAAGLSLVIFVHELGHFVVAKLCGVKVEKFYIGFDIPLSIGPLQLPSRLGRFQWGETEYGIGILPLGGYVKMLGQDDNPSNAQKEADRIKLRKAEPATPKDHSADPPMPATLEKAAAAVPDEYELDPRSYPAKPVPQRMAIISAGVIMNLIFAVLFAAFAFSAGVPYTPCEIGGTIPGSPAWRAGLVPGSRIVSLSESGRTSEHLRFDWDLRNAVGMSGGHEDLHLAVRMPDGDQQTVSVRPMVTVIDGTELPMLGIEPALTTRLGAKNPVVKESPAARAEPAFEGGDRVLAVNGQSVQDGYQLLRALAAQPDKPLEITIERETGKGAAAQRTTLTTTVQPNHAKRLGLVLTAGPISGVRPDTPAARAGLQPGDVLVSVDGQPVADPMSLAMQLVPYYGREVEIVMRNGEQSDLPERTLRIVPEQPDSLENVFTIGSPMAVRSLGIVFPVLPRIAAVRPDSPAHKAGLAAGDEIVSVAFVSEDPERDADTLINAGRPIVLDAAFTWPFVYDRMQTQPPDVRLDISYRRGTALGTVRVQPVTTAEPYPDRGLLLTPLTETRVADSWREAFVLGLRQTGEDAARVVGFLRKLFTGSVSPKNLGGPISIAAVAGSEASQGISRLLMFLTFLSANLAVLNFLPIPALDGGHMVFLAAEGIRGKPVDERMQIALTLAGVACLVGLMIFVFALDIGRFFL